MNAKIALSLFAFLAGAQIFQATNSPLFNDSYSPQIGQHLNVPGPQPADTTIPWKRMTRDQRHEYMRTVVMPQMKAEFSKFDSVRFGAMNCGTCHGGTENKSFQMPNPGIAHLPAKAAGFQELARNNPNYMSFMEHTVKPRMAALLGEEPLNPAKKTGTFGCQSCHVSR